MADTTYTPVEMDLASPRLHHGGEELQAFGTLRKMPLGLRDAARTQSCGLNLPPRTTGIAPERN